MASADELLVTEKFLIKISDTIDALTLIAPFLFKFEIFTYHHNDPKPKNKVHWWDYEDNTIPQEVDVGYYCSLVTLSLSPSH
jgi:hypothetical protein